FGCNRCAQGKFSFCFDCCETRSPFFNQKAAHAFLGSCPNDCNIGDATVCNPSFCSVQNPCIAITHGTRQHSAGIRSEVRFGQSEAADFSASCKFRQPFVLLLIRSICVDGIHHK